MDALQIINKLSDKSNKDDGQSKKILCNGEPFPLDGYSHFCLQSICEVSILCYCQVKSKPEKLQSCVWLISPTDFLRAPFPLSTSYL